MGRSIGPAASITCSSTPASTSSRPAFDRLFGVRTVSFHLGRDASTIDLARELSRDEIAAAETEANRVVWENRGVSIPLRERGRRGEAAAAEGNRCARAR